MMFFSHGGGAARALGWLRWRANKRWRATLAARYDTVLEAIVISDLDDIVVYVNAAAQDLIGIPKRKLVGHRCDVVLPLYEASGERYDRLALPSASPSVSSALPRLRISGQSEKPLTVRIAPFWDKRGSAPAKLVGISPRRYAASTLSPTT